MKSTTEKQLAMANSRIADLELHLRTERARYEGAALAHHQAVSKIFALTADVAKLRRLLELTDMSRAMGSNSKKDAP